ncbi:hypothetical protein HY491_03520 [Candidatus Woesearchaeota archaeon]|nr:hypothetical protein [Candidatus Woesearchaeota archaeon]
MAYRNNGVNTIDDVVIRMRKFKQNLAVAHTLNETLDVEKARRGVAQFLTRHGLTIHYGGDGNPLGDELLLSHPLDDMNGLRAESISREAIDLGEAVYRMGSKVTNVYAEISDYGGELHALLHLLDTLPTTPQIMSERKQWSGLITLDNRHHTMIVNWALVEPALTLAYRYRSALETTDDTREQHRLVQEYRGHTSAIRDMLARSIKRNRNHFDQYQRERLMGEVRSYVDIALGVAAEQA